MEKDFNSHPHEEDDSLLLSDWQHMWYFNSHPHEEDDYLIGCINEHKKISTHILTKRMTTIATAAAMSSKISTHILTKRMTILTVGRKTAKIYFNSHPHEEDDSLARQYLFGVTFQLTSSRRGWQRKANRSRCNTEFQLTSSRRGWLYIVRWIPG